MVRCEFMSCVDSCFGTLGMNENHSLPEYYWNVKSQEQRIYLICKEIQSLHDEISDIISGVITSINFESDNITVKSDDDTELSITKTGDSYLFTVNGSNSFYCAGDFTDNYDLDKMFNTGRFIFNPSICKNIPSAIGSLTNPSELLVAKYHDSKDNVLKFYQKITCYNGQGNISNFVRFNNGSKWNDWSSGASTSIASDETYGVVKTGKGISNNNGVIDTNIRYDSDSDILIIE